MKKHVSFLVLLLASSAWGQNPTATVTGQVSDQGGAVVVGAKVAVRNTATNVSHETVTNEQGLYTVPLLPPGAYEVSAEAQGFNREVRSGITLQIGDVARFDFSLKVGDTRQVVEVQATAPLTQTENASVGDVIDNKKVVEIPLNGRIFWQLALLVPDVAPTTGGNSARGGMNVAGMTNMSNFYTVDGLTDMDYNVNMPAFRPSVDAIQEFKVSTGTYEAEYGHYAGGQIVVVQKSGSNSFHGTLYEFLRNQKMDAVNFFTPPGIVPAYKRNQFGGTVGGPIKKDKTFFFFAYEGLRLRNQQTALSTVPTTAMMQGNFSNLPITLKVPAGYAPCAIVNNVINTSCLTASQLQSYNVMQALLAEFPAPTIPTRAGTLPANNYNFSQTATETTNLYTLRLDHTFNARDNIYVTMNYLKDFGLNYYTTDPVCTTSTLPGFQCSSDITTQLYGGGWTHIFTPSLINEFHGGFLRYKLPRTPAGPDSKFDFEDHYGIPATQAANVPGNFGIPLTSITGYNNLGSQTNVPQYRADNTYDVLDSLTWTVGKHSLKFGFQSTRNQNNAFVGLSSRGTLSFTNTNAGPTTGYGMADAVLGLPATSLRNPTIPSEEYRDWVLAAYVEDTYRVTSRLTLNYGLRWEDATPLTDNYPTIGQFDPVTGTSYIVKPGTNAYRPYNTAFGPRFGFAYQPFGSTKTVIRGGAGRYFNTIANYALLNMTYYYPVRQTQNFVSSASNPLSMPNPFVGSATSSGFQTGAFDQAYHAGEVLQWSLGIQQELARNLVLDVAYLGTAGRHLASTINLNQPPPNTLPAAQLTSLLPYPNYSTIIWTTDGGVSSFNSLVVKLDKRFSGGLSFLATYAWSKSLDDVGDGPGGSAPQNSRKMRELNYGLSLFDIPNRFTFSPVYELPFGTGKPFVSHGPWAKIIGGFQVSGIITVQSGAPVTPVMSGNFSNTNNQLLGSLDRPNVVPGMDPNSGPHTLHKWFNTGAFVAPPFGTFGNSGVTTVWGPGLVEFDTALVRNFRLWEQKRLQFRGEAFNVLNHPNFANPNAIVNSPTFGTISSTSVLSSAREIQLALKLVF